MGLNNIVKVISIIVAMAVCSTSHAGWLDYEGSLSADPGIYTYNATLDHNEEVVYEQSGANVTLILVEASNKKQMKMPANDVPGVNANGYSKLIVKRIDENTVLIEVDKKDYNKNQAIPLKYKVKGFFAKGTWSDYLANKYVQIKLTDESKKLSQSPVRAYMAKVIKLMGDAARPGNYKGIQMPASDFNYDAVIQGTKKKITQDFNIKTKFKLY